MSIYWKWALISVAGMNANCCNFSKGQFENRFLRWLIGNESACNGGDLGSIPELGRSLGEGNGNPLQYSCLENLMDRGAWWGTVHGVAKELDTI